MSKYYVSLNEITDENLEFLGYTLVKENEDFKVYQDYAGDEYIVSKENPFMYVDDINDALYINADIVVIAPEVDD